MSTLLDLPPELRLQIFNHLPDLQPGRHETIGPNVRLTPAISRTSRLLRTETLPLYARTSGFIIALHPDDLRGSSATSSPSPLTFEKTRNSRVHAWLAALGGQSRSAGDRNDDDDGNDALRHVRSLQLSRDWVLSRPSRWQGNVGFYVRLQQGAEDRKGGNAWRCDAGTYPIVNDLRGLRAESVEVLRGAVLRRMEGPSGSNGCGKVNIREARVKRLSREDIEFVVRAMDIVATHPISSFDMEQSEVGRRRRREVWVEMERLLNALDVRDSTASQTEARFYTPY